MSARQALGRQFFHVSSHEFAPGDEIVPRKELGRDLNNEGGSGDDEHVFMHDDIHAAVDGWGHILATSTGKPQHVYEVKPVGKVQKTKPWSEHDDDYELRAKRAKVVRRLGTRYDDGRYTGELGGRG